MNSKMVKVMALRNFTYRGKLYRWLAWYEIGESDARELIKNGLVRTSVKDASAVSSGTKHEANTTEVESGDGGNATPGNTEVSEVSEVDKAVEDGPESENEEEQEEPKTEEKPKTKRTQKKK